MKKGICKYFTDEHLFSHCKAGVRYRDVTPPLSLLMGRKAQLPCGNAKDQVAATFVRFSPGSYAPSSCDKYKEPTAADIAANRAKRKADKKQVQKIFLLIDRLKTQNRGKDWAGMQVCPICKQQLFVQHFGESGRTWGKCETPNCIAWLE